MTGAAAASGPTMALVAVEQRSPPGQRFLLGELAGLMPLGGRALLAATLKISP